MRRRGTHVLEFALGVPVFFVLVFGMFDYGWFFFRQSLATQEIIDAMRTGSLVIPQPEEVGCAECISKTVSLSQENLQKFNILVSASDITPTMILIGDSCTLVLDTDIEHKTFTGLVPTLSTYSVKVEMLAQNVIDC